MLDSFEKESKLNERRAARLVQMRLMEEAAAGTLPTLSSSLPPPLGAYTSTSSGGGIASAIGSTGNERDYNFGSIMGTADGSPLSSARMVYDVEMNAAAAVATFVVDDDDDSNDDDESPFSSSTPPPTPSDSNVASDHLWNKPSLSPGDSPVSSPTTTTTLTLNALAGENSTNNSMPPPGSVWRNWKWTTTTTDEEKDSRNQESRELILLASRRLSQNGPILSRHQSPPTNTTNNNTHNEGMINLHGFHSQYNEDDEYELYHRQRGAARYIKLPSCCFTFHRHIIAGIMLLTLLILLLGVLEPHAHSDANAGSSGAQPPWSGIKHNHNKENVGEGTITATITNPDKFSRIKDRLLERSISHASSLEDTSSPQYKALVWIVNEDVRQLDLPDVPDDDDEVLDKELVVVGEEEGEEEKDQRRRTLTTITGKEDEATILQFENEHALFQRYALATLYYQTTDVHIVRQSLTGQHVKDPFELPFNPLDLQKEDIQWRNNNNWLSGLGYCSWHGISCHSRGGGGEGSASALPENNDDDYYVSSLNLTSNNLNGIIPHEIYSAFPKLRVLDISKNELGGTIGREIGLLVHLQG